jgi:uncharacterized protein YecE (DUF72 family)
MPQSPATAPAPRISVGCSGWNYKSWRTAFYPASLRPSQWLSYYAAHFDTVEINNSFYRLPERPVFDSWRRQVPTSFVFAVKASRYLTHMKRLRDPSEPIGRLFERASALGPTLGPVLYQLPASVERDIERLDRFLEALPVSKRHVFEFRHPSWYTDATFTCLERHGAALCLHDMAGSAIAEPQVGPFVYVRFHGASGRYHGSYANDALERCSRRIAAAARNGRDVFVYFNNDVDASAVRNAMTLRAALDSLRTA